MADVPRMHTTGAGAASRHDRTPESGSPLSFGQQRLWFLDQLIPDKPTYNLCYEIRITGVLSEQALADGLSEIVRRHHVLRSTFGTVGPDLLQRVWHVPEALLNSVDLRHVPPD